MLLLNGRELAQEIERCLKVRVAALIEKTGRVPILATILVGDDPASATYVRMKGNACLRVGLESRRIELDNDVSTNGLLAQIEKLNTDTSVQGILLQHPVPNQIDERKCFDAIALAKDVDGVTSSGFGRLCTNQSTFGSATPSGIMRLLSHYEIGIEGRHAVIVGRSAILGKPMAAMFLNANATVTVCHSRTRDLPSLVRNADIIVGAVGKPHFIRDSWIRDGAVIIDAGYHANAIGDIEPPLYPERLCAYTPVPGGVGPMTIATLIAQCVIAAEKSANPSSGMG